MAVFKVAVTDSVFPNLDTERAILAREGPNSPRRSAGRSPTPWPWSKAPTPSR